MKFIKANKSTDKKPELSIRFLPVSVTANEMPNTMNSKDTVK